MAAVLRTKTGAERLKIAILSVTHFSKSGNTGKALHRFIGSIAFVGAPRAAFAVTDATYDAVEIHRKNIEQLIQRIDSTQNIKEATDLNNRLVSENAMLQIAIARLSAVQGNLSASAENDRVQTQATRTELLRFDSNYQYRVRQP